MLQMIESYTPFDMVFIDFWEPVEIPDWGGSRKILTCLDFMIVFGIGAAIELKGIISDQASQWAFGNLFVTFGLPKTIVVDVDELFAGIF